MANVRFRVEHALGRNEALARIRRAADGLGTKSEFVQTIEWLDDGAKVIGRGFEGRITVTEVEVSGDVVLGLKLSFFSHRVKREAETRLTELLR